MSATCLYAPLGGVVYQLGRITLAFKRTDGDAEPAYSITESIEPPGAGASLHRQSIVRRNLHRLRGALRVPSRH